MNSSRRLDRMKNVADECNSISADGSIGHSGSSSIGTGDGSSASVSTHTESHNSSEDGSTTGSSDRASSDESSGSGEDVTDDSSFSVILGNLDEIIEVDSSVKDVESSISSSSGSDLHDHDSDESHSSDEEADNGKDTSLDYVLDSFADTTLAVVEEVENAKDTSLDFVLDTFAVVESFARNSSFETEQADSRGASSDESSCSHSGIDEHSHDAVSDGESVDSGSEEIFESGCSSIENCSRSGYGDESVSDCSVSDTGGSCSSSSATNISCKSEGVQFDGIYDKKIISQCRDGKVKVTNVPFDELSNSSSGEEVTKKADKKRDNCTSTNDGSEKPSESPDSSEDRFPLVDLTKSTDERDCSPSSPDLPDPCFTSDTASIGALATKLKVTSILENISTTYYSTGGDLSTKTTAMNVVEIIGTCTAEVDTVSPDSSAPEDRHAINNECAGSFPEADNNLSSFDASALIREYVNASRERIAAILEEPTNNVIVNDKVTHATDDQESYPFNTVVSEINEVNMIRTSPLDDAFASPHRGESVDDSLYTLDADDALCLLGNKALVCHPDILDSVAVVEKSHSTPSAAAAAAIAALAAVGECGRTGNSHNIVSCGASDSGKCAAGLSDGVAAVDDNLSDPATSGLVERESASKSLEHTILSPKRTATIFAFYEPSSTSTKHSEAGHGDDVERDVHGGDADSGSVATAITAESNNVRKAISIDEKTSTASPPPSTSVHERDDNIVAEVFRDTAAAAADDTPLTVVNNCNGCHEGTSTLAIPCTSEEGGEYTKSSQKSTIFSFYEPTIIFTEHSKDVQGDHDKGDAVAATAGVESTEVRRSTFIGNTSSTAFHPSASEDERLQDIHQSFLDTTATDDTSPTPVMEGIGCHNGLDTLSTPSVQVREHATSSKKRTTFAFYEPTLSLAKHSEDARGGAETVDNDESNDAKKSPFIYTMLSPRDDHVVAQTFTGTSAAEDASSIPSPGQESKGLEGANKSETACIYDASVIIQAYVKASKKRVSAILGESINSDEEKEEEDNKSSTSINLNDPTANISSIPVPDNLAASNGAGDSIKMISVVDSNTCAERPFSLDACTLAKRYVKASKKRVAAILGESISTDEDEDDDRAMVMAVASESKVVDTIDTGNESPPQSVAEDITLVVDPDNLVREYINASKLRIAAILEESQSISTHVQTDHDLSDDVDGNTSTSISFPVKDNEKDSGTNLNNEAYSVKNDETNIGTNREKESDAILSADVHPTNTNATLSSKGRSTVTQVNSSSIWDYDIWVIMLVAVVMFGYKQESEDPFEMEATGRSDEPISFVPSSLVTRGISVFGSQTRASKYKSRPVILEKSDVSNDPLQTNQNTKTLTTINTKKSVSPIAKGSVIKNMKEGNGKDGNEKMSNVNNVSLVSKGISLFGQQTRAHRYNKRSVNMKKIIAKADEDKSTQRKTAFKESLSSSPGNHASKSMCQHDLWLVAILSLVMIVFKSLTLRKKQEGYVSSP